MTIKSYFIQLMNSFNQIIEMNLLSTLCFIGRFGDFSFSKRLINEKEKKNLRKNQVRYKEILLFRYTN